MPSARSYCIDRHIAQQAVHMSLPLIQEAMQRKEVGESGFLYLVILDPVRMPGEWAFEEAVLYEHAVGDVSKWDADYAGFARAKARVAWRTGQDGHHVQELRPHMLVPGDTVLWGSVVLDGLVVSCSGAQPWYDEAFAGTVAMCLRAMAKEKMAAVRGKDLFLPIE